MFVNKRFAAGIIISFLAYSYSVGYDEPGSLELIIQSIFNIQPHTFEYMYSFYSIPNIFFCFLNGILLDKLLGLESATFGFTIISIIGQIISTIGCFTRDYWIVLSGRVIYGLGAESLSVCLNYYIVIWFIGKEINVINALYSSFMKLGTATVFSFNVSLHHLCGDLGFTSLIFVLLSIIMSSLTKLLGTFSRNNTGIVNNKGATISNSSIKLSQLIKLPTAVWLNASIIALQTGAVNAFVSVSQEYFRTQYNVTLIEANNLSSLFNLVGGLTPVIPGLISDSVGYDLYIVLLGGILGVIAHFIFLLLHILPYIPLILFALSYATINTVCWALIAFSVKDYQLASSLGLTYSLMNLANTICPLLTGFIIDKYGSKYIFVLFQFCFSASLLLIIITIYLDRTKKLLVMSVAQRKIYFNNLESKLHKNSDG